MRRGLYGKIRGMLPCRRRLWKNTGNFAVVKRNTSGIRTEVDASYIYGLLAGLEKDPRLAQIYRTLSATEMKHAESWLREMRTKDPQARMPGPSGRALSLGWIAKHLGMQWVLPVMIETERGIAGALMREKTGKGYTVSGREDVHARILRSLQSSGKGGVEGGSLARFEGRHHAVGGNALRAGVLGANDGLLSNLSLIMGVAGAAVNNEVILITGLAGLLAGAFSMALGEWLSVQSSRELYRNQIEVEASELESSPEEEAIELSLIYQAKGVPEAQATEMARSIVGNPATALDTLAREELGVDPEALGGSAWTAALASFFLFAAGAIIPVIPYFWLSGTLAVWLSLAFSAAGLFGIGAGITLMTGRSIWFSGGRQLLFGLTAAAVTYGTGYLLGIGLRG